MKTTAIVLLIAVLGAGSVSPVASSDAGSSPGTPDTALGLSKGSVFDTPTPPRVKANESGPGEQPVLARPHVLAPPRVPHVVADFLPITAKQNSCLDCHAVKGRKPGEPTPIPPSHYTDERNAPGSVGTVLSGARYVCVSCHVETTDTPSLVENRFRR
jgi:cytochrome c-type protein NapB